MSVSLVLVGLDGDPELERLERALVQGGLGVRRYADPVAAAEGLRDLRPDLAVVDLAGVGFAGVRALLSPSGEPLAPMVVLTAADDPVSRVVAFELGADDAVSRPWSERELVLRVHAILRARGARVGPGLLTLGPLRVDETAANATIGGRPLPLSAVEARLLAQLVHRRGALAARDALAIAVWGAPPKDPRALDTAVKRLRRKLTDTPVAVHTVRGVGFRIVVDAD